MTRPTVTSRMHQSTVATRPWRDSLPEEAVAAAVVVAHGKHYIVYLSVLITVDNIGLHCMYRVQGYGFIITNLFHVSIFFWA